MIYGFQVALPNKVRQLSERENVKVKLYSIIYELLDDVKKHLCDLLEPEMVVTNIGRLLVRAIFKTTKNEIICGGEVTKGKLVTTSFANIYRENKVIAEGLKVSNLKSGPTDVKEVQSGEMCGLSLETESRLDIKEGDRIEFYTKEKHQRSL
jgi:translation initiation factor IF-2